MIEGAQGERTNVTLYPKRGKDEVRVTAVDKELVIVYHLGCEPYVARIMNILWLQKLLWTQLCEAMCPGRG